MAEFSGDIQDRSEAAEADSEDKGLALKPHAQAHLLSATEYCKVKLVWVKVLQIVQIWYKSNNDHKSDLWLI